MRRKNRLWGNLMLVVLASSAANVYAAYSEQWMDPQQLKQEEARTPHAQSTHACKGHTAYWERATPAHRLAENHSTPSNRPRRKEELNPDKHGSAHLETEDNEADVWM
jgi:hypothetical protein